MSGKCLGLVLILLSSVAIAAPAQRYVPGEYIVKMKPFRGTMTMNEMSVQLGAEVKEIISNESLHLLVRQSKNMEQALAALNQHPMVEYAEPNFIIRLNKLPNDPSFEQTWGLKNTGQTIKTSKGVAGVDISAEQAWEITTGSKDVVVAVIDTGVDHTNPDLNENMWVNEKEAAGEKGKDDDGNGFVDDVYGYDFANKDGDPKDDHGHGTHCAGTIGAQGNNEKGVAGVNWSVRMMGVKFLTGQGSGTTADAIKSIDYAAANGARIISASWGGGDYSKALEESIRKAGEKGVLFVAAAGNDGRNNDSTPSYPATYKLDNIISVAAVDNTGSKASFSNYGKTTVHIGAPGVNIYSTTLKGLEYYSGTSMATPHVSGVAALLFAHEPNLTVAEAKERLLKTVKPLPGLRGKTITGGMVNALNALTNVMDPNDPTRWPVKSISVKTEHPYANKAKVSYTIKVDGAAKLSVHFARFETEERYDVVNFYDNTGKLITTWSGLHNDEYSPVIDGDTIVLELVSDQNVSFYGFEVDQVAYKTADE